MRQSAEVRGGRNSYITPTSGLGRVPQVCKSFKLKGTYLYVTVVVGNVPRRSTISPLPNATSKTYVPATSEAGNEAIKILDVDCDAALRATFVVVAS